MKRKRKKTLVKSHVPEDIKPGAFVVVGGQTLFVEQEEAMENPDGTSQVWYWCTDKDEDDYYIQADQVTSVLATIVKEEDMPKKN